VEEIAGLRRTRCGQTWENESLPAGLRNLPTLPRPTASFSGSELTTGIVLKIDGGHALI